jgi:transposase
MLYAGIDLHRRYLVVVVLDSSGAVVLERRLANDPGVILGCFGGLDEPMYAVVEAMGSWQWLHDLLVGEGIPTMLAHPFKVRAIAAARLKNDRIDARILADLLRAGLIPPAYVASPAVRTLRELLRHRAALVRMQTGLKNRLRALLAKRNLAVTATSLMSRKARAELAALKLTGTVRRELDQYLELLDHLAELIQHLNIEVERRALNNKSAKLLMTIPGVGYYIALMILAEIGDVRRFPSARKLASYAGLVPTTRSSGDHTYHGHITKQGSSWLRWAAIEVAMHLTRQAGPLRRVYERQRRRKGPKVARVALARKVLTYMYWMLKHNEPYDAQVRRLETVGVSP